MFCHDSHLLSYPYVTGETPKVGDPGSFSTAFKWPSLESLLCPCSLCCATQSFRGIWKSQERPGYCAEDWLGHLFWAVWSWILEQGPWHFRSDAFIFFNQIINIVHRVIQQLCRWSLESPGLKWLLWDPPGGPYLWPAGTEWSHQGRGWLGLALLRKQPGSSFFFTPLPSLLKLWVPGQQQPGHSTPIRHLGLEQISDMGASRAPSLTATVLCNH